MSFFKRHPKFWTGAWTLFGLGALGITFNGLFDHGFDAALTLQGVIGSALAAMMIGYLLPWFRKTDA